MDPTMAVILEDLRQGREAQDQEREARERTMQCVLENQEQQMQTLNWMMQQLMVNQ